MTDREKIIEIIAPFVSAYGEDKAIADALIETGIGDVKSLTDGNCVLYVKGKGFMRLYNEQDINKMIHSAMVAERKYMIALNKYAKCDRKLTHYNKMTTTYDKEITEQAEREIEEEGKR